MIEGIPILILHGWRVPVERYFPLKKFFEQEGFEVLVPPMPGFDCVGSFQDVQDSYIKGHPELDSGSIEIPKPACQRLMAQPMAGRRVRNDGRSVDSKVYSLDDYIEFINDFLKKKKIGQVFLIGHSFGGRVAIKYAAHHAHKVKALVLTGVPAIREKSSKRLFFLILAKIGKVVCAVTPSCFVSGWIRKMLYNLAGEWDYYKTKGAMRETFKKIVSEDLTPFLSKIKAPTLLVWGEKDEMVPVGIAYKMNKKIPKVELSVISYATHKLPYENSQIFLDKCLEFFGNLN